jgi:hypothetical protein
MDVCERNLDDCDCEVRVVSVGVSTVKQYFLCGRCQRILREKLSKDPSMPDWWQHAKANRFTGRPLMQVDEEEFCPGY